QVDYARSARCQELGQLGLVHAQRRHHGGVAEPCRQLHSQLGFEIHRGKAFAGKNAQRLVSDHQRGAIFAGQDGDHVEATGASWATNWASWAGLNGFSTVAAVPARRARSGAAASRNSVSITTRLLGTRRCSRRKASPSGRVESSSTRSGRNATAAAATRVASVTQVTVWPSRSSLKTIMAPMLGSSSTTRTRAIVVSMIRIRG